MRMNFKFWCPIEKSVQTDPSTGQERMVLGGIASTSDEDSDGEFLDPNGFDITPLMSSGTVNWHHQAKNDPSAIIGEPIKGEIRREGLYLETLLYPNSKLARDVWDLANTLEKNSPNRRLGYSIEGKVLERKSDDPNNPDYKKIVRAVITGVAVTHQPKNHCTFANIIKGEGVDWEDEDEENSEEDTEKSLNTNSGAPLRKESPQIGVKTTLSRGCVMEYIFSTIPAITFEKAEQVFKLIKDIANMKKKKSITAEDISKAYDALGLQKSEKGSYSLQEWLNKGEEDDEEEIPEEEGEIEDEKGLDEEEIEDEEVEKAVNVRLNRIEKAVATSHLNQTKYIKALGVIVKAQSSRNEELMDIIKAQGEQIDELQRALESYGSAAPKPKSVRRHTLEREFDKGEENDIEKGADKNTVSISQKSVVANLLDQATFAKGGYDEEFSKACLHFEATGSLPGNIVARLKNEFGIQITK